MPNPRIISLGMAFPDTCYTQEESWHMLHYQNPRTLAIFKNSAVEKRHLWVNPYGKSWQELCEAYKEGALDLSLKSAQECLGTAYDLNTIRCLVFCSVSGYQCPSMSYWIAKELGLREDIVHANIMGQGCEAAVPGIRKAYEFTMQTHQDALVIATEVCSASYFPAPENDLENTVANAIFGDGSSATLIGYSAIPDPNHPYILDFESIFSPDHVDLLGYKWQDGRLKVVLHKDVPKLVPPLVRIAVQRMLSRNHLWPIFDKLRWILHPGGARVLEGLEKELGLSREQTSSSWEAMRLYGNVSSATIGVVGKLARQNGGLKGYTVVASMGAGTACDVMLLRGEE